MDTEADGCFGLGQSLFKVGLERVDEFFDRFSVRFAVVHGDVSSRSECCRARRKRKFEVREAQDYEIEREETKINAGHCTSSCKLAGSA
jgi:hypothetical protein